jgi:hypothetical protein
LILCTGSRGIPVKARFSAPAHSTGYKAST